MARRTYVGPIAEIVTRLDGVEMILERGDSVDVSAQQAEQLDACPENWAAPRQAPPKKDGDS
jgi:hypothetical protein